MVCNLQKNSNFSVHKEYKGPPPGAKSLLSSNGEPSVQLQHLSLSVLDAFGSVHDILQQSDLKHATLTKAIDAMPVPKCHDDDLLLLKATSQAALQSMESSLNILQDLRDLQVNPTPVTRHYRSASPMPLSPKKGGLFNLHSSHQELQLPPSPNFISPSGSPTKAESFLSADSVSAKSVKSAQLMDLDGGHPGGASSGVAASTLSASTSNIDQAGHKTS